MERNKELEEKLSLYALGALDENEMKELDEYMKRFPDVAQQLKNLQETVGVLPFSVSERTPPPAVKAAVLQHVRNNPKAVTQPTAVPQTNNEPSISFLEQLRAWWSNYQLSRAMSFGGALALVLLGIVSTNLLQTRSELESIQSDYAQLQTENGQLVARTQALQGDNEQLIAQNRSLLAQLESEAQLISYAADANSQRVTIPGTEAQPQASGGLFIRPDTGELLLVLTDLQPLSEEQIYQLWLIEDIPVSAGLVNITPDGTGIFKVDLDTGDLDFNAVGLSVEPSGGSDQPTGDIVLYTDVDA